jgi:hypothetical protein
MAAPLHTTQKLIDQFIREHQIPLRLRRPRFWQQKGDAYYDTQTFQFTLPASARGAELREFTFHEIGHALIHQFRIPKRLHSRFVEVSPHLHRRKAIELMNDSEPAPLGWVSWYAMVNGTEDFCETLGAWVSNDYRTRGLWRFNNFVFNVGQDRLLQKKIRWVREILDECGFQASMERATLNKKVSYFRKR